MGQSADISYLEDEIVGVVEDIGTLKSQKRIQSITLNKEKKLEIVDEKGQKNLVEIPTGPQGLQGPAGPPGPQGLQGPAGQPGANASVDFSKIPSATIGGITISGDDVPGATQLWKNTQGFYFYPGNGLTTRFRGPTSFEGGVDFLSNVTLKGQPLKGEKGDKGDKGDITMDGFGPYSLRFYGKNTCLDVREFEGDKTGAAACTGDNNQKFFFNPVSGQLKNLQTGTCLDRWDNKWRFTPCVNHENQQFYKTEHLLRWKNEDCLDIGGPNRRFTCNGNNDNQKFRFDRM